MAPFVAALLLNGLVLAQSEGAQQSLRTYKLGQISSIIVKAPSNHTDYNPQETCDTFVITPRLAKLFLSHAKTARDSSFFHQADLSSCESEGTVTFVNGDKGEWVIARNGVGLLSLSTGKYKDTMLYLHCFICEKWKR